MNEFAIIEKFFTTTPQEGIVLGIGDDAACVEVPPGKQLLISTDTLVAGVHFLPDWDPFDMAWKAVMVNISDIAAMGGEALWITLALTLPEATESWVTRFSQGLQSALEMLQVSLLGGDISQGPLSFTITALGLVAQGKAVRRGGATVQDSIWVTGLLGAAALGVEYEKKKEVEEKDLLISSLKHPIARVDMQEILQKFASSAIDISDGLAQDLQHICKASKVGALLHATAIPVHPVVKKYKGIDALAFALSGGDDYELCFTVPASLVDEMQKVLEETSLACYCIGTIEQEPGLRLLSPEGEVTIWQKKGYMHFP